MRLVDEFVDSIMQKVRVNFDFKDRDNLKQLYL